MMGGCSSERQISLKSGAAVLKALKDRGLQAFALDVTSQTEDEVRKLVSGNSIDVVFVVMHGGFGEDGRLQEILEKIPVAYTGPGPKASNLAMDKCLSRSLFVRSGLRVPSNIVLTKGKGIPFRCRFMGLPLVVKPSAQGSSIGITFVKKREQLKDAVAGAFDYGETVLIEEFINGREVTVSVLDGKALPVVEIRPKKGFFDYEAKYQKGFTEYIVPASLDSGLALKIQEAAVKAYQALGCRHLSRIDMIVRGHTPYVLEVNTIPGMTETSLFPKAAAAAGMDFGELCERLVGMALDGNH